MRPVPPSAAADGIDLLGSGVWPAALVMAEALQAPEWARVLRNADVLELGSGGSGYAGIAAALSGGSSCTVTLSDKQPQLVADAQEALLDNHLQRCAAIVYSWGDEAAVELHARRFDVLLASDCFYSHGTCALPAAALMPGTRSFESRAVAIRRVPLGLIDQSLPTLPAALACPPPSHGRCPSLTQTARIAPCESQAAPFATHSISSYTPPKADSPPRACSCAARSDGASPSVER